jgi:uroporphyrinogen decarboxylase
LGLKPDFNRLDVVLRREGEPDRVPFYEHLVDVEMMEAITGRRGTDPALHVNFYRKLAYDYVPMTIHWPFERTNFVAGDDTAWIPRSKRRWVDQMHGTIENWEDFEEYPFPDQDTDYAWPIERISELTPPDMGVIAHAAGGVLENSMWLMGARPFIRALYSDRRLIRALVDRVGSCLTEAFRQAADVKGVGAMCLGDDMGLRTGTMIPPKDLRRYIFPWQRKICRAAHSKDLPFILHACGNVGQVMEDLIEYVGIDAKHSFEDAIMPVARVKERWGERVVILGGIDVDVLARREVPQVVDYVRSVMGECLPGGSWVLGSGNSIPNYVKVDNYLAMLKAGERWGRFIPGS